MYCSPIGYTFFTKMEYDREFRTAILRVRVDACVRRRGNIFETLASIRKRYGLEYEEEAEAYYLEKYVSSKGENNVLQIEKSQARQGFCQESGEPSSDTSI